MEVRSVAEIAPQQPEPTTSAPATPAEGPRDPSKRRFLKAAGKTALGLGSVGVGVKLGYLGTDLINTLFPPAEPSKKTQEPTPPPVQTDIPASEKAINQVEINEITKKEGGVTVNPYGGPLSAENPYGASLFFAHFTIVDMQKNQDGTIWVAISTDGNTLIQRDIGKSVTNFDGTKTEQYGFTGLTAWLLLRNNIVVIPKGSNRGIPGNGFGVLENYLKRGTTISFDVALNYPNKDYEQMNVDSFNRLLKSDGKSTLDRSDQSFKFVPNTAYLDTL